MISEVANLIHWEWFKLSRRWMPWILLFILVAVSQIFIIANAYGFEHHARNPGVMTLHLGGRNAVSINCNDVVAGTTPTLPPGTILPPPLANGGLVTQCQQFLAGQPATLQSERAAFSLPGGLVNSLGIAEGIGGYLLIILTASIIGSEYGSGTYRAALSGGVGRRRYLASKLGLLFLYTAGGLIVMMVLAAVTSAIAGALTVHAANVGPASFTWIDVPEALGRMWVGIVAYTVLAFAATVLTASTAGGMAIGLVYGLVESILVAIFSDLFSWFHTVADYLFSRNVDGWVSGGPGMAHAGASIATNATGLLPGQWHAFAVVAVYMVVLAGLAFWSFTRRDVKGPAGV